MSDDVSYRNTAGEFGNASRDGYEELVAQVRSLSQQCVLIEKRPEQIKEAPAGMVENLDIFVETAHKDLIRPQL